MFAVVHLPQHSLQAVLRHQPDLWAKPVVLIDPARTTPLVCDVTESGRIAGVTEGLTPTQALARCPGVLIRHRSIAQETSMADLLLQCAYGFSPHLELTGPGFCTLDLRGLATLRTDDSVALKKWIERLQAVIASFGLRCQIGLGATPQLARHGSQWGDGLSALQDAKAFIASLPIRALEPSTDVATILRKWGIHTVGALLALGQEALADRLGLEALALCAAASTHAARPLRLVRPAERFDDSFDFDPPVETVEPLLFLLRRFVDQLCLRLELAALVAARLTLKLHLESGEVLERELRVPQPTAKADTLFRMLHTHLETLRTSSAIAAVGLEANPTPAQQKQLGLFEAVLRDPQRFQETLARLTALLGADRVGTPILENSHRPDAFKVAPPDFDHLQPASPAPYSASATMPLRRFRPGVKARVRMEVTSNARSSHDGRLDGETPLPLFNKVAAKIEKAEGRGTQHCEAESVAEPSLALRPVELHCAVANGQLRIAIGPWCTSGHWWEPNAWEREEWDIETTAGMVLRLSHHREGWFVEGILD